MAALVVLILSLGSIALQVLSDFPGSSRARWWIDGSLLASRSRSSPA
jgi:hypothetical protein